MGVGRSSLCLGKDQAEDLPQPLTSQSETSTTCSKRAGDLSAWTNAESQVFSDDLARQSSRSHSRSPSTSTSLGDETHSVSSSGEWSSKNSISKGDLDELYDPVFIVKNTFIDVVMPPVGNSRVRSSSAPPSPDHRTAADMTGLEIVTGASPRRLLWADEIDDGMLPSQQSVQEANSVPGTAPLRVPATAAPTTQPARLPLIMVGLEVELEGLTRSPEFNGLAGTVQGWEEATGRYDVMVHGSPGRREPFLVKVKAENVQRLDPPPPDFDATTEVIPGTACWDEAQYSSWSGHCDLDMTLTAETSFQHYPGYYHDTMAAHGGVSPMPMPMPISPMSMPVDCYSPQQPAGVYSQRWLPEAR